MNEILNTAKAAIECAAAMDKPTAEALSVLQSHGFDYSNRFENPASQFVADKLNNALEAISGYRG
jgi:hypothetical protein